MNTETVEVRRARLADCEALVDLRATMFSAMGTDVTDPDHTGWRVHARAWFAERIEDPRHCLIVVAVDGQVVSGAVGSIRDAMPSPTVPEGRDILIANVATVVEARGRGYGRAAYGAVMSWARSTGIGRAELLATDDGKPMYLRDGFTETAYPAMRAVLAPPTA